MAAATFYERDLLKERMTMTITVKRGTIHPYLMRLGMWVMTVGARIAGIGRVEIADERAEP